MEGRGVHRISAYFSKLDKMFITSVIRRLFRAFWYPTSYVGPKFPFSSEIHESAPSKINKKPYFPSCEKSPRKFISKQLVLDNSLYCKFLSSESRDLSVHSKLLTAVQKLDQITK